MRTKQDTQRQFELKDVPGARATVEYFARYDRISELLDAQPQILAAVHGDLVKPLARLERRKNRARSGKYTSEQVLRMVLVKLLEGLSFREAAIRMDDSSRLRSFTRLYGQRMMDFSTLCLLTNMIRPETWKQVNELLAHAAVAAGEITGEHLRLDTTATETNIHFPTDSHLLWDVMRVLTRLVLQARGLSPALVSDKRLHAKAVKRLHTKIARVRSRRTEQAQVEQKRLYGRLIRLLDGILGWVPTLCDRLRREVEHGRVPVLTGLALAALAKQIEEVRGLGLHAVDQARRRVLFGEQVPNDEKLFSIFEPHTELLIRGKAGKEVEFGHMVSVHQVSSKFISDYEVFERKPADYAIVDKALARHESLFGARPEVLAADKGFWESTGKYDELSRTMGCVAIPKKGKRTEEETEREHGRLFRLGQRFRAGVEGTIAFLKRVLGMARCLNKGWRHFEATIGATVFAHNLLILVRATG